MEGKKEGKTNKQFMILSAIAIIQVVICHFGEDIGITKRLFPYTSFFMSLFIFISGYFYNVEKEKNIWKTIWNKFKKIMIPFFIINLCYGVISTVLRKNGIINYGAPITLKTLFVEPFINNNQFVFNFPSWFVPNLFVTYTIYILIHKASLKLKAINDYILLIIFFILGLVAVYFKDIAQNGDIRILLLRVMFFLPMFQFGYLYKKYWQEYDDKISTIPYLIGLAVINLVLKLIFENLKYDMHEFAGFHSNAIYLPFITSITGILFWLRISRILCKWIGENKLVNYISNNTFSIMSHHLFWLFLVDFLLYAINLKYGVPYFNIEKFKNGWIYIYEYPDWNVLLQICYVVIGVLGPLAIKCLFDKLKIKISLLYGKIKSNDVV